MENYTSDQLEEGEIVDDDDLEAISDNSIIDSTFGKFVTSNENLRALSLSSDSETDIHKNVKHKRKLLHRKNRIKHQRKRKKLQSSTDSSDSDASQCLDLKGKLKEAIHISGVEGTLKNPLEARLKGMGGLSSNTETVSTANPIPEPPPPPSLDGNDSDKVDDNELEMLRMEALKTAVLNKFQRRKKKKALMEEQKVETKPLETLENKENNTPKDEVGGVNNNQNQKIETKTPVLDLEEDEDVLRASLLAGLAKKITKTQPTIGNFMKAKPVALKLPIQVAPVLPKRPINNFFNNNNIIKNKLLQNRLKSQVKPLIIKIDGDSDSEEEVKQKPPEPPPPADLKVITNSVEKFLKEQRAKFETETQKRFQLVNKSKNKTILEKSAVKLLPKSQQIEYQQLLKRLKTAERRKRAKKIALQKLKLERAQEPPKVVQLTSNQVTVEVCPKASTVEVTTVAEPIPIVEVVMTPTVQVKSSEDDTSKYDSNGSSKEQPSKESDLEKRRSGITSELTTLQRTLKEIKMQRNGSLQIKSKYQVLTPIIRKITATSNERKKHEQRIKNLLQELNEARSKLSKSHETFSALVRELVDKKETIDRSYEETKAVRKTQNGNIIRKHIENVHKAPEKYLENNKKDMKSVPVTSTPIKTQSNCIMEEATVSTIITSSTNNDYEDMDVCNSDETDMCQIDIVDPNDIDQIFKRKTILKPTIPEYVSPLNFNTYERYRHVDPLGIMCPYEVNGSCRDIDCTFKHYLKNQ